MSHSTRPPGNRKRPQISKPGAGPAPHPSETKPRPGPWRPGKEPVGLDYGKQQGQRERLGRSSCFQKARVPAPPSILPGFLFVLATSFSLHHSAKGALDQMELGNPARHAGCVLGQCETRNHAACKRNWKKLRQTNELRGRGTTRPWTVLRWGSLTCLHTAKSLKANRKWQRLPRFA